MEPGGKRHNQDKQIDMSQQRLNVISNGLTSKSSLKVGTQFFFVKLPFIYFLGKPGVKSADDVVIVW